MLAGLPQGCEQLVLRPTGHARQEPVIDRASDHRRPGNYVARMRREPLDPEQKRLAQ